jgi:hypothetical protein
VADRVPSPIRPAGDEIVSHEPPAQTRVGRRLLAIVVIVGLATTSGWWLTRVGLRSATAPVAGPATGAWFCPHGGGKGWQAWIVVANPGPASSTVRITSFDGSGSSTGTTFTVDASHHVFRTVPARSMEASTEVEFFGGWVAATAVIQSTSGSIAAERCVSAPQPTWLIPDAATGEGEDAFLVVMNPFDINAEFDVVLRTEDRTIRPGPLTPGVLQPGRSMAVHVNQFALEGPGESTVTAEVRPIMGRVVAGGVGVEGNALRAEAGQPAPAARLFIPAAGYAGTSRVYVENPGPRDAVPSVVQIGPTGVRSVSGTSAGALPAGRATTFEQSGFEDAGDLVTAKGRAVLAAAVRLESNGGDQATVGATAAPSRAWVVPAIVAPTGGTQELALFNPGSATVQVTIQPFGDAGPAGAETSVTVPAGRTVTVSLSALFGTQPLSSVVTATDGAIVVGTASFTPDGKGFAATSGVPVEEEVRRG